MSLFLRRFPFDDTLIVLEGAHAGKSTDALVKWAESIERQTDAAPVRPDDGVRLENVGASDAGTLGGADVAGTYRVSAYREVVVADPVSSALGITIGWTHNGKALTRTLSAFGGAPQTVNDTASDLTVVEIDPGTTISYTLTYASNTPGLGRFFASLVAELLEAA